MFKTIEWKEGAVRLLDQTKLPKEVLYVDCRDVETVAQGIKELWVRGAPAIGITAAYGLALAAQKIQATTFDDFYHELLPACELLAASRPTAVNLFWAIDRMKQTAIAHRNQTIPSLKKTLLSEADRILSEDIEMNRAIGRFGAPLIQNDSGILTHCNAGALATGGYGTALGVIRRAWEENKQIRVYADETRPVLQGARLTVWELVQEKIPVTLITDNMAGFFMKQGKIQYCVVGADRIAANGDIANKIGTYSVAILAKEHQIPFYVAAPMSTVDFKTPSGEEIPIEERDPSEVTHIQGKEITAPGATIANPAFDVTPARYITAIITDKGIFKPKEIKGLDSSAVK
ncbi:MAG: S-methyl-5-thioribose-1-phosphate isomerase [Nitrospira sp.]|nr:S-methyl-5-thioribose-1-phosphate isomerase [Candidatus Manganitrophaceae bacterium]HIL34446.1 S-methyl-5-thioribose-1-phosphate isomerase [Candidatus Manganitrophaceae bacterium]